MVSLSQGDVMTPDLKAALSADRTVVHAGQEPDAEQAYQRLLSESVQAVRGMSAQERAVFSRTLPQVSQDQVRDLSIGYASANFKSLDRDADGRLDKKELTDRLAQLSDKAANSQITPGLPVAMESKLVESLVNRHSYLRTMAKTGSWWNLNKIDPEGLTREDIDAALKDVKEARTRYNMRPLRPDIKPDKNTGDLPDGVEQLFKTAGVEVKTVDIPVSRALAEQAKDSPIISIAAAVYIPHTKEIFVENNAFGKKAKLHESGHAIDDALVPGAKFFSESAPFNHAVDMDIKELNKTKTDWQKALPTVHVFIMSGLEAGQLSDSARKELFAELYQSGDPVMADNLRKFFPRTGALVDQTLLDQGLSR